jgi:uncharacterized protein YqjF (DUF2071 family)
MIPVLSMRWEHVLFLHWPVEPSQVDVSLPDELDVATYDDRAWLGVVAFRMPDLRPRGSPVGLDFHEVNLRTYVRPASGGPKGVYFYNLDAGDWLGVVGARTLFRLPYYHAEMRFSRIETGRSAGEGAEEGRAVAADGKAGTDGSPGVGTTHTPAFRFLSRRDHPIAPEARVDLVYRPSGDPAPGDAGSLDEFVAENYRFYTGGRPWYCEIGHDPWQLRDAAVTVRENGLFEANGFDRPDGDPITHYTAALDVTAGRLRAVDD